MTTATFNRSRQILQPITALNATDMTVIYDSSYVNPNEITNTLKYYGFITDLRATVRVNSFAPVQPPVLRIGSSASEKAEAIREAEFNSERCHLAVYLRNSRTGWTEIYREPIVNRQPFYTIDLTTYLTNQPAFAVSSDSQLAVRLLDIGFGLIDGDDSISIYGSAREEVTALPNDGRLITTSTSSQATATNQPSMILAPNPYRKGLDITNLSETDKVSLSFNPGVVSLNGIVLYPGGGSFSIAFDNLYQGAIFAISESNDSDLAIAEYM
ncbi:MAG: hypothetical protein AAF609_08545 [Cyanobacteria bacterium P01_C01_bin.120]